MAILSQFLTVHPYKEHQSQCPLNNSTVAAPAVWALLLAPLATSPSILLWHQPHPLTYLHAILMQVKLFAIHDRHSALTNIDGIGTSQEARDEKEKAEAFSRLHQGKKHRFITSVEF